jgi:N-formylmaleamate deformylase
MNAELARELAAERARDIAECGAISRTVDADGVAIHLLDYGGDGPATIVIPGITSPAITWDFAIRDLADVARLYVLDLRGRGLSDREPSDYSVAACAADVAAVARALQLDRPILLGHSLGARIAAVAGAEHPELFRSLILVDPPLSGPKRGPYPMTLQQFLDQLHEAYAGTTVEAVASYWPGWPLREHELRVRWLPTCSEDAVAQTHAGFESEDFFDVWPRLAGRADSVAFVNGGRSAVVTAEGVAEARRLVPDATFVEIPDAGHMIPWENFDGFQSTMRELLRAGASA